MGPLESGIHIHHQSSYCPTCQRPRAFCDGHPAKRIERGLGTSRRQSTEELFLTWPVYWCQWPLWWPCCGGWARFSSGIAEFGEQYGSGNHMSG